MNRGSICNDRSDNNDDDNGWNDRNELELSKLAAEMNKKSQIHGRAKKVLNLFNVSSTVPTIVLTAFLGFVFNQGKDEDEDQSLFRQFIYHVPNILLVTTPLKEYMQFGARKENHDHFSKDCGNFSNEITETLALFPRSSRMHFLRYAQRATDRRAALNDIEPGLPLFFSCCGCPSIHSRVTEIGCEVPSAASSSDDEESLISRQSSRSQCNRSSLLPC